MGHHGLSAIRTSPSPKHRIEQIAGQRERDEQDSCKDRQQFNLEHLPQDDHLRQREPDYGHHECQSGPHRHPLRSQYFHDRDHTGCICVERDADQDRNRNGKWIVRPGNGCEEVRRGNPWMTAPMAIPMRIYGKTRNVMSFDSFFANMSR